MALEPRHTYRLVPRGDPGLTCDSEGAALGGIPIAWRRQGDDGMSRWQTRSTDEIEEILHRAYGLQRTEIVNRCHRGLRRVVTHLEAGDLALAAMEALMLRLPRIGAEGMAKLVTSELSKGGDASEDEPRVPPGQPGGGEWTTGGTPAASSANGDRQTAANGAKSDARPPRQEVRPPPDARSAQPGGANPEGEMSPEIVVQPAHRLSMKPNANGFFRDGAGGGVFYIPSATSGEPVRPTEVHAVDANAFEVGWRDGVISLTDAKGNVVKTGTTPAELDHFNATTGRALGVAIYAFPGTRLGSLDEPASAQEQQRFDEESAAQEAGVQASLQTWSGRLTSEAVQLATELLFLEPLPVPSEASGEGLLNTAEGLWPRGVDEVSATGSRATIQGGSYQVGIRSMYPETTDEALRFGEGGKYSADAVATVFGKRAAIDAKYVNDWATSIRNPDSKIGAMDFAIEEQDRMVLQAKRYDEFFEGGSIYHTNSPELASYYYRAFRAAGVTKARFIITPAER